MPSSFTVHRAAGYEQLMGRWSRKLAGPFLTFAGVANGERVLDVGCGTGSLTFALPKAADVSEVAGIDFSPVFVEEAQRRNADPRITIQQGDACALPFPDGYFDRALALLVLHFVPNAEKAVAEMRRVVRPGGVVAAAVWDHLGGMPGMRMMWDTLPRRRGGPPNAQPVLFPADDAAGRTAGDFHCAGPVEVAETELLIRMQYENFADYWAPIAAGEGPLGKYVVGLDPDRRIVADKAIRAAYKADDPTVHVPSWRCHGLAGVSLQGRHEGRLPGS